MTGGYFGRLLDVDFSGGRIGEYRLPDPWLRSYLGGKGLAARVLLEEYRGGDPLGPDNPLIYMTGPLVGALVGGSGRHVVVTHSPLTGFFGEAYCGGFFGSELKRTGFDGIIIRGKSDHPVYLSLFGGAAELHDASSLWGKTVLEVDEALLQKHGEKAQVSCIGPAGENLVRFAAIMNNRNRANARCGVGAVMGSKRLKAIVLQGHLNVPAEDPKRFNEVRREYTKTLMTEGMKSFGKLGTAGGVNSYHEMGIWPTRNFQAGGFHAHEALSGETMAGTILTGRDTCTACPVSCKREVEVTFSDGTKVIHAYGGPEYETISAFGSTLENARLDYVALANQLCNAHGLDTISTGVVIGWAMEASEKGLLADSIPWGDGALACRLVEDIAHRRGVGDLLAEGVKRASERVGGKEFAVHVKGCELPMHEPRGKKGLGISYAVSPRGANHMEGFHDTMIQRDTAPELGVTTPMDRFAVAGKGAVCKAFEDARSYINCLILCVFDVDTHGEEYNLHLAREMTNAVTGFDMDVAEMQAVGERAWTLGRLFALRMGLRRSDDDLPPRIKELTLPYGGGRSERISDADLRLMLSEYYAARGWDAEGRPTPEKRRELGLDVPA